MASLCDLTSDSYVSAPSVQSEPVEFKALPPRGRLGASGRNGAVNFPVPFGADGETRTEVLEPELPLKCPKGMSEDDHVRAWAVHSLRGMYGHIESTRSIGTVKHAAAKDPPIWLAPVKPCIPDLPWHSDAVAVRAALEKHLATLCDTRMSKEERVEAAMSGCVGTSMLVCHRMHKRDYVNRRPNLGRLCQHCREVQAHAVNALVMVFQCFSSNSLSPSSLTARSPEAVADRVAREITRVRFSHPMFAMAWTDHVCTTALRHLVSDMSSTSDFLERTRERIQTALTGKPSTRTVVPEAPLEQAVGLLLDMSQPCDIYPPFDMFEEPARLPTDPVEEGEEAREAKRARKDTWVVIS